MNKSAFWVKLIYYAKNKYVLSVILFIVWISFFDTNNLVSRYKYKNDLQKLVEEKEYYLNEIERNMKDMNELESDPDNLEKFAREKYYMKKDDEEIFIIVREETLIAEVES